jgi:hypothetical protein
VIIPALAQWHPHHEVARTQLTPRADVVGHCTVESYSVLTRLPEPHRLTPEVAAEALARLIGRAFVLDHEQAREIPRMLADAGVRGGATYDGLVAITAKVNGATLVTLDAKASQTYRKLGVDFELLRVDGA